MCFGIGIHNLSEFTQVGRLGDAGFGGAGPTETATNSSSWKPGPEPDTHSPPTPLRTLPQAPCTRGRQAGDVLTTLGRTRGSPSQVRVLSQVARQGRRGLGPSRWVVL